MSMSLQTSYLQVPPDGILGQLDGNTHSVKDSFKNADSVSIPFGSALAWKPTPTSDIDVYLPALSGDKIAGLLFYSNSYSRAWTDENGSHGQLDGTGITAGSLMNGAIRGRIYVKCMTGCKPGDPLFVCYTAATTYTAKGQLGNADESTNTLNLTNKARWVSTATAGNPAWLEFDFVNA